MAYISRPQTKTTAKDRKINKYLEQLLTEVFLHDVNFFNLLLVLALKPQYQDKTVLEVLLTNILKFKVTSKELDQLQTDLAQLDAHAYSQTLSQYQHLLDQAQSQSNSNLETNSLSDIGNSHSLNHNLDYEPNNSDKLALKKLDDLATDSLELDERQDNQGEWVDTLEEFAEDSFDSDEFDDFGEESEEWGDEIGEFDEFEQQELVQDLKDLQTQTTTTNNQTNLKTLTSLKTLNTNLDHFTSQDSTVINKIKVSTLPAVKWLQQFTSSEKEHLNAFIKEYIDAPLPNPLTLGIPSSSLNASLVSQQTPAYDLLEVYHYTQELAKLDYFLDYSQNFSSKILTKALTNALVAINEEAFTCNSFVEQQDEIFEELFNELDQKELDEEQVSDFGQKFKVINYLETSRLQYNFSLDLANRPTEDLASLQQLAAGITSKLTSSLTTTNTDNSNNSDKISSTDTESLLESTTNTATDSTDSINNNSNTNSINNDSNNSSNNTNTNKTKNLTHFSLMSFEQAETNPWYKLSDLFLLNGVLNKMHCFDISHWGGEDTVGSCVAANIDGVLVADYRYFNITGITPGDDIAAIFQAVDKRYRSISELTDLPLVIMIDGGQNQINAANKALNPILKNLQARQTYLSILLGGQTLLSTLTQKNGLLFAQDSNYLSLVAAEYVYDHYMQVPVPSNLEHNNECLNSLDNTNQQYNQDNQNKQNNQNNLDSQNNQNTYLTEPKKLDPVNNLCPYRPVSIDTALKVLFTRRSLQNQLNYLLTQDSTANSGSNYSHSNTIANDHASHNSESSTQPKLDAFSALSQALGSDSLSQRSQAKAVVNMQEQQHDYVLNRLLAYCQTLPTWQELSLAQQKQILDYLLVSQASTHLSVTQLEQGIIADLNDISLLDSSHPLTQFSLLKRLPYTLTLQEFKNLVFATNSFYVLIHPVKTIGVTKQDHRKLYAEKFLAGDTGDVIEVPMHSNEQYLILKLRDAAHNYANRKRETHYQRTKTYSFSENLLAIPSIGQVSVDKLLTHFTTPANLIKFLQENPNPKSYLIKSVGLSVQAASSLITNAKLLLR